MYKLQGSTNANSIDFHKSQLSEKSSKVLLVCVYDTIVFELNNHIIHRKFQKFGVILKLLIFQKGQVTKFFIQYQEVNQAVNGKNTMDGAKLCQNLCKMTIYFSNFSNFDLKHQTSQGVHYIRNEVIKNNFIKKFDILSKGSQYFSNDLYHQEMIMNSFDNFGVYNLCKTEHIEQQLEIEENISKGIDSLLASEMQMEKEQKKQKQKNLKLKEQPPSKSAILSFKMRYQGEINKIYNLFINFGNISWIQQKKLFAAIAYTYLSNTYLYGNLILFQKSNKKQIEILPHQGQYADCIFYDSSYDRFTRNRSITINPPSHTIHISSIKKQICKENALRKIFSQFGEVEKIHILHQSKQKNMALIKFYSIEDSFCAISSLHNKLFFGRKMQISFTKSKV